MLFPFKRSLLLSLSLLFLAMASCSEDDNSTTQSEPFVVAFENLSANLSQIENSTEIALVYSTEASESGAITISVQAINAVYGQDFITEPEMSGDLLSLPITQGSNANGFTFTKLNPDLDETTEIVFTITNVDHPASQIQGNTAFTINASASLGRSFAPTLGGPNQQNQVFIDLSTEAEVTAQRDHWDLGFYSGAQFRVTINGAIYMAAAELESTNIDEISEADVNELLGQVAVGTFDPINENYIDHPDGDINKTAMAPVSANLSENKVYLVNLGYEVGTETPEPGSVAVAGEARGYKKIRVLREGDDYLLQFADLNDTNHQEILIEKSEGHNFTFFSFNTNSIVPIEPEASNWDIVFTVFTNLIEGSGSYGFSDGVLHNRKGGVRSYEVLTSNGVAYNDFSLANLDASQLQQDQRTIGSNWRDVFEGVVLNDRFYIIEDPNGNHYKLRFLALTNDNGIRGYPEFEYQLLQ